MTPTFYHRSGPGCDGFTEEFHFGGIDDLLGGLFGRAAEGRGIRLRGADREGRNPVFDLPLSVALGLLATLFFIAGRRPGSRAGTRLERGPLLRADREPPGRLVAQNCTKA
jgi:hypothetical protein